MRIGSRKNRWIQRLWTGQISVFAQILWKFHVGLLFILHNSWASVSWQSRQIPGNKPLPMWNWDECVSGTFGTMRDKCNEKRLIALYVHHASLAVHECSSYFLFYFHHAYLTQKMKTSFGVLYRAMSSFAYSPPVMMMCVVSGRSVTFNQYGNVAFYSGALNHSSTSTAVTFR